MNIQTSRVWYGYQSADESSLQPSGGSIPLDRDTPYKLPLSAAMDFEAPEGVVPVCPFARLRSFDLAHDRH